MEIDEMDSEWTICPYCGGKAGDSSEYNRDPEPNLTECFSCGKEFWQWADYSVDYCTAKLDPTKPEALD